MLPQNLAAENNISMDQKLAVSVLTGSASGLIRLYNGQGVGRRLHSSERLMGAADLLPSGSLAMSAGF